MRGTLNTKQNRTTTRNFRVPLGLDDKVTNLQNELGHYNMTETLIYLIKIGIEQEENLKKLEEEPSLSPEAQDELKQKCEGLTDVEAVAHTLTTMSDKHLHFLKGMIAIEEERKEMVRKEERQRKAKAAFELDKKMRAAGIGY